MHKKQQFSDILFGTNLRPHDAIAILLAQLFMIFAILLVLLFIAITAQRAQAQTYEVIHKFTGVDGANPYAGLTMDSAGNLYGTEAVGGHLTGKCAPRGCGRVFRLSRKSSGWTLASLYDFTGGDDGLAPGARVIFGPDGMLYGTTNNGGGSGCGGSGCGTVFRLHPPAGPCPSVLCPWIEEVIHRFTFGDGNLPVGDLIFDNAGSIYGVTSYGGEAGGGVVYQLTPLGHNWTFSVLHNFYGYPVDGGTAGSGVIFDTVGNLYGTTTWGGANGWGTVYQLTGSGSAWTENVLYSFAGGSDGYGPCGGLIFDGSGNLYGSTVWGDAGEGTIFELGRGGHTLLYTFGRWEYGPLAQLTMDSGGNLYGTLPSGGVYSKGAVFKLTLSDGHWTYTSLHDFTGGDGFYPMGNVTLGANGILYGTAAYGGAYCWENVQYGCGVVWKITP